MPTDLTGSNVDPRHVLWQDYYSPGVGQDYTSSAGALINDLTSKRVKDLLSGYATSGLSRSGIQGAAVNNAYSQAGQQLSSVAAQGSQMDSNKRLQILRLLFGEQAQQANQPGAGDFFGTLAGGLAGSFLGPIGAAAGAKVGNLI